MSDFYNHPKLGRLRIHKYELVDDLGDGHKWGVWACQAETEDGNLIEGFVQGDEHSTAEETLELEGLIP